MLIFSDFFYVWLKRALSKVEPELFRIPVTPKSQDPIEHCPHSSLETRKGPTTTKLAWRLPSLRRAVFLSGSGICCVMFAHKSTSAWGDSDLGVDKVGLYRYCLLAIPH